MGERVQIVGRGGRSYLLVDDVLMPAIGGGEMLMEEADAGPDFSIFFPSGSSDDDSALFELNQSIVGGSDIFTNPATATSTSDRLRSDADLREVSANADGTLTMADGRVLTQASNPGLWDKLTKALGARPISSSTRESSGRWRLAGRACSRASWRPGTPRPCACRTWPRARTRS